MYLGCAFGIGLLDRLSSSADQLATAHEFGGKQEAVMLFVLAAFLVKFFWAEGGKGFYMALCKIGVLSLFSA